MSAPLLSAVVELRNRGSAEYEDGYKDGYAEGLRHAALADEPATKTFSSVGNPATEATQGRRAGSDS